MKNNIMAAGVWVGKYWDQGNCWVIRVLNVQRLLTLGGLQITDVEAPRWPLQVPGGKSSRCRGDLELGFYEVCSDGDGGKILRRPS